MQDDIISFDEMVKQIDARRKVENPWTEQNEANYQKKRKIEQERQAAWEKLHPTEQEDDEDDEDDDDENNAE